MGHTSERVENGTYTPQNKWSWLEGVRQQDVAYMQQTPFSLSIPSHGCIVAHAGLVPGVPLHKQQLYDLIEVCSLLPRANSALAQTMPSRGCCLEAQPDPAKPGY